MIFGGIAIVLNPLLFGVGDQMAGSMGVNTSSVYNSSSTMQNTAVSTGNTVMQFLPWLGIGLIFLAGLVGKNLIGKLTTSR